MMVICPYCKIEWNKTIHSLTNKCHPCKKEYDKAWREKRKFLGLKAYGGEHSEKYQEWYAKYIKRPAIRKRRAALMREYRKNPKTRSHHLARELTHRAIRQGLLIKQNCRDCQSKISQAHHPDYSKPLKVIWLCAVCHRKEHAAAEKEG